MKFCQKCGKEIMDEAVVCPDCGCGVNSESNPTTFAVPKSAKYAKIFGGLSLLLLAPFGIPAIILANKSKAETGGVMCKDAKAGLISGIIGLCWWGLCLIMFLGGI